MRHITIKAISLLCLSMLWAGCAAPATPPALPTATPAPTQVIPSSTPTPLPPPTVTPFPTLTPRPTDIPTEAAAMPDAESTSEGSPSESPIPATEASSGDGGRPANVSLGPPIFSADFAQGWPQIDEETAKISLNGGAYSFTIGPFDARFMNTSAVDRADYYVEVDVNVPECPEGTGYGLLMRQQDANNYYAYIIFCNSTYSLLARVNGSIPGGPLEVGSLPDGVSAPTGSHTLGVMARGQAITVFYDGEVVTDINDDRHQQGDIALYVLSQGSNPIQVDFDNLEVWAVQ